MSREAIAKAQELCTQAMAGRLSLEGIGEAPNDRAGDLDEFLTLVYDDVRAAVEHTPGYWLRRGVDHASWQRQYEFHLVYLDSLLLNQLMEGTDPTRAVEWRQLTEPVLREHDLDLRYIEDAVNVLVSGAP